MNLLNSCDDHMHTFSRRRLDHLTIIDTGLTAVGGGERIFRGWWVLNVFNQRKVSFREL